MFKVNENYLKLPGSYLFSNIGKKVAAYKEANPDKSIISLGIGDVTQPLAPEIIKSLHSAVDEMGKAETFHGYAPDLGYEFLRNAIVDGDYKSRGCDISADEIFVSDGAKCDSGNIQEIFSVDNKIAVCDPVYPVYVDTNVMAGRTGTYNPTTETWSDVIYMPCTAENDFVPDFPKEEPDIIYLCFPNNPTGTTITKAQLQEWVDYANKIGAVIISCIINFREGTAVPIGVELFFNSINSRVNIICGIDFRIHIVSLYFAYISSAGTQTDNKKYTHN
jgi:LL-diaminopimelate aminotransferase